MAGRILYEGSSPVTQTVDAVKSLIAFSNHGKAPETMPEFYKLSGDVVLVQSAKKDSYYVLSRTKGCSCPSAAYRPGSPCKHARKFFGNKPKVEEPVDSIRPDMSGFRPVLE